MKVLVTGARGFIGRALHDALQRAGDSVVAFPRMPSSADLVSPLAPESAFNTIIHLAARVHVMHDRAADPLSAFREVNVGHTLQFAARAAASGVRRFVFVSSVKVHGEATERGRPFTEHDTPAPQDPYAISKWEAEQGLRDIAARTGMEVVIIRPPLVYGPGVKANFASLMRAVQRGLPLPLGAVDNLRSLVGLDNLVDFIITCARHPAAANQTFLVSDGVDVSTPALVRAMARAAVRPARLVHVPVALLSMGASLIGKRAAVQRVIQNLQLDMSKARNVLQWTPPLTLDEGLRRAFVRSEE